MQHKSIIENFDNDLWGHHFRVPSEVAEPFVEGTNRRVVCSINSTESFACALMHIEGGFFINLNKEIRRKLNISVGNQITYTLEKDQSKYGIPLPPEMKELLEIDDDASHYFHKLTPGKQRSLLYIIGKPKSSDARLRKALAITDYLKENKGNLDFREMNQFIKDYNRF